MGAVVTRRALTRDFLRAAHGGNLALLEARIQQGTDVNGTDDTHSTALIHAAAAGHHPCVELLLHEGADVNKVSKYGERALNQAVSRGHVVCMELLITAGADVNTVDRSGQTALIVATSRSYHRSMKLLLQAGADVNARDGKGCTALLHAASEINYRSAELLIKAGANVNVTDSAGFTVLKKVVHKADIFFLSGLIFMYSQTLNCVNLFLKSGAHVNTSRITPTRSPREHVEQRKSPSRTKLLTILHAAGEYTEGATVERVSPDGSTRYIGVVDSMVEDRYQLQNLCREVIRRQLLQVEPPVNLFVKVPRLGLPRLLGRYLLYNRTLDD